MRSSLSMELPTHVADPAITQQPRRLGCAPQAFFFSFFNVCVQTNFLISYGFYLVYHTVNMMGMFLSSVFLGFKAYRMGWDRMGWDSTVSVVLVYIFRFSFVFFLLRQGHDNP